MCVRLLPSNSALCTMKLTHLPRTSLHLRHSPLRPLANARQVPPRSQSAHNWVRLPLGAGQDGARISTDDDSSGEGGLLSEGESSTHVLPSKGVPAATMFPPEAEFPLIAFHIPAVSPDHDPSDVLELPNLHHLLTPRDSPLVGNDNWGCGFTHEDDRIALNTLRLKDANSSGATDMCIGLDDWSSLTLDGGSIDLRSAGLEGLQAISTLSMGGDDNDGMAIGSNGTGNGTTASDGILTTDTGSQQGKKAARSAATSSMDAEGELREPSSADEFVRNFPQARSEDRLCVALPPWAVRAGARRTIYFDPATAVAAVVTIGGICPGLNDVVQGIVHRLTDYGMPPENILGVRNGLRGFIDRRSKPIALSPRLVDGIQLRGGSLLGTSRGLHTSVDQIIARLRLWGINMLFVVAGEGGQKAGQAIKDAIDREKLPCVVIGVPKSIDNDLLLVDKTFGFDTAVEESQRSLLAAKIEASSGHNGIGLVQLMGRRSGFLAMQASLASGVVDACLIPEARFTLPALEAHIRKVLERQSHAVICVAEGAGADVMAEFAEQGHHGVGPPARSSSSNAGIGPFMASWLRSRFDGNQADASQVFYIDPRDMVCAVCSNSLDHTYAKVLASTAVDAAFAAFTGVMVGVVNTHYALLPTPVVVQAPRRVDPAGKAWIRLRTAIGQPTLI